MQKYCELLHFNSVDECRFIFAFQRHLVRLSIRGISTFPMYAFLYVDGRRILFAINLRKNRFSAINIGELDGEKIGTYVGGKRALFHLHQKCVVLLIFSSPRDMQIKPKLGLTVLVAGFVIVCHCANYDKKKG